MFQGPRTAQVRRDCCLYIYIYNNLNFVNLICSKYFCSWFLVTLNKVSYSLFFQLNRYLGEFRFYHIFINYHINYQLSGIIFLFCTWMQSIARSACNDVHKVWTSQLPKSMKIEVSRATVEPLLLYESETCTLSKKLKKKNFTILTIRSSWTMFFLYHTNHVVYLGIFEC